MNSLLKKIIFILLFITLIFYIIFSLKNITISNFYLNYSQINYNTFNAIYNNYSNYLDENLSLLRKYFYESFIKTNKNNLKIIYCQVANYSILTKEEIIKEANIKGQEIINKAISEAQKKAQEILEQAYNQGYSQGYNEIKNKLEQEYQQKIQELQKEIQNILNLKENLVKEMEKDIVELAIKVAEKVINKKIEEEPELVSNYLLELLPKIEQAKNITIWINPNEIEYVKLSKEKFKNLVENVDNINIAPDSRIEKGGCIIETNFGKIDARISTKLEVLKEIIHKNI